MTPAEVETKLTEAMDKAVKLGWEPTRYVTLNEHSKRCCAIGAYRAANPENMDAFHMVRSDFGLTIREAGSIASGFDNVYLCPHDEWFQVGARIARRFVDKVDA